MAATAAFAMLWAIARAAVQSITIDEADTYLMWVARTNPSHWQAGSNNHVLNSLLMRLSTSVFGLSHLSVRAPALLGAALYIAMAWAMCALLAPAVRVQWPLFVGLVFNPFVFDHLVAARGYALALGFLMAAIAAAAYSHARGWVQWKACAVCSASLALSFAANFSFAIVDAFLLAAIAAWACSRTQGTQARSLVLGACVLPGLLVTLFVSAPAVLHFPRGDLQYGAHSLGEWFGEVVRDSLWELNPQIVNPMLMKGLVKLRSFLAPALLALAAWEWVRGKGTRLSYLLLAVLAGAVATHWAAFRLIHLLLPKERTGIWVVPLVMLAAGAVASGRRCLTVSLYGLSFYFLLCLRLNYFREWAWDADVKQIYGVLAYYNHTYGLKDVSSNWRYSSALNYYRLESGRETLDEIDGAIPTPQGRPIFVLNWTYEEDLVNRYALQVVYRAPNSDAVVAVRRELVTRHAANCGVN